MADEQALDLRAVAKDAYTFGYAMIENYRTLYRQAVDEHDPRYVGGFGVYRHYWQPATPANTDIVTPNNDTPYSWLWLDLRAQPWVVTVPAIDRYYILPFRDLYTLYAGYIGAVTTGPEAGSYLIAGPSWDGTTPDGLSGVIRAATEFVGCLTRTALMADGVDSMKAIQHFYQVQPLDAFLGATPAAPKPAVNWPEWQVKEHTSTVAYYELLDFLLQFAPILDEDADIRARMASMGLDGTGTFKLSGLNQEQRAELETGLADGIAELQQAAAHTASSTGMFGTHADMPGQYTPRNVGAMKGLYGLPASEAWYGGWLHDDDGNPPNGVNQYTVTFTPETLPKVKFFWSATMYRLPERLLADNDIDRYSIGDRTPGLVYQPDGSLTLYIGHDEPADPTARANWLPAPARPFTVIARAYGGDEQIATGKYALPKLIRTP